MNTDNNGWHVKALSEVVGSKGIMIDGDWVESKDQDPKGDIRLIQLADVGDGKYLNVSKRFLTKEKAEELKCTYLHQGDVLIARMPDPLGRACIFPGDEKTCVTVVDVCIVRADKSIANNKFLMYKINTSEFRNSLKKYISGTTRARISRSNLEKIKIEIPSLPIQKQIAEILEKADEAKHKRKEANKFTDEFLKSVFIEMFGDPVNNPKGWELKKIKDLISIPLQNGAYFTEVKYTNDNNGTEMVHMSDAFYETVKSGGLKRVIANDSEISKYRLKNNDILIARRSLTFEGAAKACLVRVDSDSLLYESSFIRIRVNEKYLSPIYLFHFLSNESARKAYILKYVTSSTISGINQTNLAEVCILIPPLTLQQQFAEIVNKTEALKEKQKQSEQELENLFQSLMQKAFKGELVG